MEQLVELKIKVPKSMADAANEFLAESKKRMLPPKLPPSRQRMKVYSYLLAIGFSKTEAVNFPCLGREYKLAVKAMKYSQYKAP